MSLSLPYRHHHYMGEYSSDANCLMFIQANKWDSDGDGSGTPQEGMTYYNSTSKSIKTWNGTAWTEPESTTVYENTDIDIGTEAIDSFADTSGRAVFWDYVVYKSANLRAGRVVACWDAASNAITYSETCTTDVGTTTDLTLSVDINSNNVRLLATAASDNWAVKVSRKLL
jgi:hypothetical protein